MQKNTLLLLSFIIITTSVFSQVNSPALPNTSAVVTCFPDTAGYKTITVGLAGRDYTDLQQAIDAASLGTMIVLDAGETFKGGFTLPNKTSGSGWIIIISSRMDLIAAEEIRIKPNANTGNSTYTTQAAAMAKIITVNTSGIPCFATQTNAHHYRFVGLEITADNAVINSYGLINLGDASSAQNSISQVPDHFVVDRCYIHGHTQGTIMKFGIRLDCANAAIIDSYISDFHSVGYDAQAIAGVNGPGPFKIINNYLEASGENILFGGAAASIKGLVPSDIEIRQNYFYKPWSWKVGHASYAGKHWTIKNLFELKTGVRVLFDGNILENCWADLPTGQSGYAILLTIRTEGGGSPQAEVSDITISNNIIKHVGAGITFAGTDGGQGIQSKRVKIYNNLFEDINGPALGDANIYGPNDGTFIKIGQAHDVIIDHNTIFQTGLITWAFDTTSGLIYTNNISHSFVSTGSYQGIYGPGVQQGNATFAKYFTDITDANKRFHKNVMIGGDVNKYTNFNSTSINYYPASATNVGFVNYANGSTDYHNYALSNSSSYHNNATDNTDIGADFVKLDSAQKADRGCGGSVGIIEKIETDKSIISIYPNPAKEVINVNTSEAIGKIYNIADLSGKIVITGKISTNIFEVRTEFLVPGIYILSIGLGDNFFNHQIVILQ